MNARICFVEREGRRMLRERSLFYGIEDMGSLGRELPWKATKSRIHMIPLKKHMTVCFRDTLRIQEHGGNASLIDSLLHSPLKNARGESRKENPGRSFESSWCKKAIGLSFWS